MARSGAPGDLDAGRRVLRAKQDASCRIVVSYFPSLELRVRQGSGWS